MDKSARGIMPSLPAALAALVALAVAGAHAAERVVLDGLAPAEYSLSVTGTVSAEALGLPGDNGDGGVTDEQLRARDVPERALYTEDTFYKPASGPKGPFELTLAVGPAYVTMDGVAEPGLSIRVHFGEGIEPGTYEITDGFLDAGPNGAPVSVLVSAASADRGTGYAFGWEVDGMLTLEQIDREAATGHFRFRASNMNREGRVTDEHVTAEGAFRQLPFLPEAALPGR